MRSIDQLRPSLSRCLSHSLTFPHTLSLSLCMFLFCEKCSYLCIWTHGPCRVRTLGSDSGRKTHRLWATTLQCPWMTLLLRPSRRRCHYNWRCCHGCHDERWQNNIQKKIRNKNKMEFNWNWNWNWNFSRIFSVSCCVCRYLPLCVSCAAAFFIISTSPASRVCIKNR